MRRHAPHDTRQKLWLPAETMQTDLDHLSPRRVTRREVRIKPAPCVRGIPGRINRDSAAHSALSTTQTDLPCASTHTNRPIHNVRIAGYERVKVGGGELLNVFLWASSALAGDDACVVPACTQAQRPRF